MTIDIQLDPERTIRYEADFPPRVGETITVDRPKFQTFKVMRIDYLLTVGYGGEPKLSLVTVEIDRGLKEFI
jgi:hypothetical protein